jgi:MFS transporter, DHA3 family, macrolide efflux protein
MLMEKPPSAGLRDFAVVCFGQLISLLGTGMTGFALSIWGWKTTGSATALSLLIFFAIGPGILIGSTAGAFVDRGNRKRIMILADTGAAITTACILLLYVAGSLHIWHVYAANLLAGLCQAFQRPAYTASITLLVPQKQYGRANGMMSLVYSIPDVAAPLLAGALVGPIGVSGIMIVDLLTFGFAVAMIALVTIPQPPTPAQKTRRSLWNDSLEGFRMILTRRGLFGLQLTFLVVNFFGVFQWALQSPMILARTHQDSQALGLILSFFGIGSVAGGLVMSAWGGPQRKIHGVLAGMALECTTGILLMGLGRTVTVWALSGFLTMFFVPIVNSSNTAIWQSKVAPELQGRVFGARRAIAQCSYLIGFVLAGPVADHVFEPAMRSGGALADALGGLVGTGPGAGMALILMICGILGAVVSLAAYFVPVIRHVESIEPIQA